MIIDKERNPKTGTMAFSFSGVGTGVESETDDLEEKIRGYVSSLVSDYMSNTDTVGDVINSETIENIYNYFQFIYTYGADILLYGLEGIYTYGGGSSWRIRASIGAGLIFTSTAPGAPITVALSDGLKFTTPELGSKVMADLGKGLEFSAGDVHAKQIQLKLGDGLEFGAGNVVQVKINEEHFSFGTPDGTPSTGALESNLDECA